MSPSLSPFRRPFGARPLVYGHRGARARAPENTLAAFQLALDEGADGNELDVRLSADGTAIVLHDDEIRLPKGGSVVASRLSFEQIRHLPLAPDARVPCLEEVMRWHKNTSARLNVELKRDSMHGDWLARTTAKLIDRFGDGRVIVSSFDPTLVLRMARLSPSVPVALLVHDQQRWARWALQHDWGWWKLLGACGVHPEAPLVSRDVAARLRHRGAVIGCWTVNDPERARELAELGVDALMTDDPSGVLTALGPSEMTP